MHAKIANEFSRNEIASALVLAVVAIALGAGGVGQATYYIAGSTALAVGAMGSTATVGAAGITGIATAGASVATVAVATVVTGGAALAVGA
jgi:hypothetical protein